MTVSFPPSIKQLNYIHSICEYLEIDIPKFKSKEEATMWLQFHVPIYKKQLELDSLYWEANHSEICENYGDWKD